MNLGLELAVARPGFDLRLDLRLQAPITALFGPSGSGKTTLLHALAGLVRPTSGRIWFGDRVWFDAGDRTFVRPCDRRVGLVFQDLRLFPHLTVEANLEFGRRGGRRRSAPLPAADLVGALELGDLMRRRPHQLSGGERQRVALGRALLATPDLLLMDEPLAALDQRLRRQILPYLRWVHERFEIPIVYVSHSLPEVLELTDQIVVLERGRVAGEGEVFDVLGSALGDPEGRGEEPFVTSSLLPVVADWIHEEGDFIRGRIGEQEVFLPFAVVSPGQPGRVAVAPDDVMLARERLAGVSARNQLRGVVERISHLHGRLLVHLRVGPDAVLRAELTRSARADLGIELGVECFCVVKTSAFRWQ